MRESVATSEGRERLIQFLHDRRATLSGLERVEYEKMLRTGFDADKMIKHINSDSFQGTFGQTNAVQSMLFAQIQMFVVLRQRKWGLRIVEDGAPDQP